MDYIFQDETTSVRKGINQIMKKQKLEILSLLQVLRIYLLVKQSVIKEIIYHFLFYILMNQLYK